MQACSRLTEAKSQKTTVQHHCHYTAATDKTAGLLS